MTTTIFTHTISGRKVPRYLPHHHRGPAMNKSHAVVNAELRIRDGNEAATVCGAVIAIQELPEVLAADGGPLYNCRPASETSRVTCKDCRKQLGL